MSRIIFYSWQNDLPTKTHRNFIDKCIQMALKSLEKEAQVYMEYDRDTKGLMGSPDITESIFGKIDKSVMFVCDISIINQTSDGKKTPNPNVLIELGYAANKLGWDHVICLFDLNTGQVEELPFDLRQKRITPFDPEAPNEKQRIADILALNIKDLFVQGKLFNPLNDYMKGKIDKALLDVGKQLANLMFGTYTLSEGLAHVKDLLSLSRETILDRLCTCQFPAFIVLNTYERTEEDLKGVLKDLFSSSYFPKEWAYCVLELLDWIRVYRNLSMERNPHFPFFADVSKRYDHLSVMPAKNIDPSSTENEKIVLEIIEIMGQKKVDIVKGQVLNTTNYPSSYRLDLAGQYSIKEGSYQVVGEWVYKFVSLCNHWLDITDSEFILDPDTYFIT